MSKILIVYGTSEGQTAKIAQSIEDVIATEGHSVEVLDSHGLPDQFELSGFDGVIVGASVHVGKHDRRIVDFVKSNLNILEEIPSAFFSVSLTAAGSREKDRTDIQRLIEEFVVETGWHPEKIGVIAGALMYTQYGLIKRFIMKMIVKQYGGETDTSHDYEYIDWDGVKEFATNFLSTLPSPRNSLSSAI